MNKVIVGSAFVIIAAGSINAIQKNKPLTPVFVGGYVFLIALGIADLFGPPFSTIASAFAVLAMVYILLTEIDWTSLLKAAGFQTTQQGATQPTQPTQQTGQTPSTGSSPVTRFTP